MEEAKGSEGGSVNMNVNGELSDDANDKIGGEMNDKMTTGVIFDIRRYSIHDGPGIRTAVFFKGCPLHCAWCHNPESHEYRPELMLRPKRCILCDDCLEVCPHGAVSRRGESIHIDRARCRVSGECALVCPTGALEVVGREMTVAQVLAEIERDRVFFEASGGGATFSGGEPLAQPRFLHALLAACREAGIHTVLDTCGYASWATLEAVRPLVDLFLYDLKLIDPVRHKRWTGRSNARLLSNLRRLSEAGSPILVRMPIIPGVNDDEENLRACGRFLAGLEPVPDVELLPYHAIAAGKYAGLGMEDPMRAVQPPGEADPEGSGAGLPRCAGILREYGLRVVAID